MEKMIEFLEPRRAFDILLMALGLIQERADLSLKEQPVFQMQGRIARIRAKLCALGNMDVAKLHETISDFGLNLLD